jgi:hypothetical protein
MLLKRRTEAMKLRIPKWMFILSLYSPKRLSKGMIAITVRISGQVKVMLNRLGTASKG